MKLSLLVTAFVLCLVLVPTTAHAQSEAAAVSQTEVKLTDETEQQKVRTLLLLQENASLRKQLAQTQKQLAEANVILSDIAGQNLQGDAERLLRELAEGLKLDISLYDFQVDPTTGKMKFVLKSKK